MQKDIQILESSLSFCQIPTLVHTSGVSIVLKVWTECAIDYQSATRRFCSYPCWSDVERNVIKRLCLLPITKPLREKLAGICKLIRKEVENWFSLIKRNETVHFIAGYFVRNVCWMSEGRIDYAKTAEALIFNTRLDYHVKYELACLCCYVKGVIHVSSILERQIFRREHWATRYNSTVQNHILLFWTARVTGQDLLNLTIIEYNLKHGTFYDQFEYIFHYALNKGNECAVKYFWNNFTPAEQEKNIKEAVMVIGEKGNLNMLCFFLAEIENREQSPVFNDILIIILETLFSNPEWQKIFIGFVPHIICKPTFCKLVNCITLLPMHLFAKNIVTFKEMIRKVPLHLLASLVEDQRFQRLLCRICAVGDKETIDVILNKNLLSFLSSDTYCKLFVDVLANIPMQSYQTAKSRGIFHELWNNASISVKEHLFSNDKLTSTILTRFLWIKDLESLKLMSINANKPFLHSLSDISCLYDALLDKDSLSLFVSIGEMLPTEMSKEFKEIIVQKKALDVCIKLITRNKYNVTNKFLNWCFQSESEKLRFKEAIASEIRNNMATCMKSKKFVAHDFPDVEKFLSWCRISSEDSNLFLEPKELYHLIDKLTREITWTEVQNFMKWWFLGNEEASSSFKYDLLFCEKQATCQLILNIILFEESVTPLGLFLEWCFSMKKDKKKLPKDMHKYKYEILDVLVDGSTICKRILQDRKLLLADQFVSWCCNHSKDKITTFKQKLILQDDIFECFDVSEHSQVKLIWWFSPSVKTANVFKEKYKTKLLPRFFIMLDAFMGNPHVEEMCDMCRDMLCKKCRRVLGMKSFVELSNDISDDSDYTIDSDYIEELDSDFDVDSDFYLDEHIGGLYFEQLMERMVEELYLNM